jgi:hypothetical protein
MGRNNPALVIAGVLFAVVLLLMLMACSAPAPQSGQVVGKHYEEPFTWTSWYCAVYGPNGACVSSLPQTWEQAERWVLTVRSGREEGDLAVPAFIYQRCRVGARYPTCAEEAQ